MSLGDHQETPALSAAIDRARMVILWERIWPRLVLFLVIAGAVLAVSWLGFWQLVPYWARMGGVLFVIVLLTLAAWPVLSIRRPTREEALARVDRATGGGHRPATALADTLATRDDPFARAIWAEHKRRVLGATERLRTGFPLPRLAHIDRYAIRALALLLIVPAYFLAGDERTARLMTAFDWRAPPQPISYRIDAWVTPPTYTARAPVILPTRRGADGQTAAQQSADPFRVPAGSVVTLRVTGLDGLGVTPEGGVAARVEPPREEGATPPSSLPAGVNETRWVVADTGALIVTAPGAERLAWRFEALPDRAPTIRFEGSPQIDPRNQLIIGYALEDDYGVTEAEARMALAPAARALATTTARPLAELPPITLTLPQARVRSGTGSTARDFVAHPFAGLPVEVTLHAKDDAGNTAASETIVTTLPARAFTKPIARALIEQRRLLALDANARRPVARALEALTIAPGQFGMETAVFLGLRTAYYRVARARSDAQLKEVIDYLWDIAVRIEDGDVSEAERAAQAAAERLRQAIERGASPEEIRRLSQELRQAMDRLMRELAEQALRNRQDNAQNRQQPPQQNQQSRQVRPQDLRDMLNRIENLARNGARDQAQRLMQELQQMLQGLQAGRQQQGNEMAGDGTEQGESALDQLSDMIRRQQELRDQTFRRGQEQRRAQRGQQQRPGQRGQQPGQQGQQGQQGEGQGEGPPGFSELSENQRQLRELLDQLSDQLGQGSEEGQGQGQGQGQAQQGLGQAGRAMRDAEGALGRGDSQGAMDAQARALRGLQQGAQGLAQQMQEGQGQQGQGNQPGQPGRTGQASGQDYDPLGRPTRGREANDNSSVRVPNAGEGAAQRAQRVLEELRRRLSDPDRPQMETDYIERLLRGLQIQ